MTFFYDLNKKLADLAKGKEQLTEGTKPAVAEASTGDYSAKKARAGKDIGKPGKQFAKIAKGAAERYGSKERGEKVAGAVLAKLRGKNEGVAEGNDGNLANNAKPYDKVTRGDVVAGRLGKDEMGGKAKKTDEAAKLGRDMTQDLVSRIEKATGGRETAQRDAKGVLQLVKKKMAAKRKGPVDEVKLADLPVRQVKGRAYGAQPEEPEQDDGDTEVDTAPKKKGRPKGTGRKLGAKGPTGRSKLMKKGSLREGPMPDDYMADIDKLVKVIRSVKTADQLAAAKKMAELLKSKYVGGAKNFSDASYALWRTKSDAASAMEPKERELGLSEADVDMQDPGEYDQEGGMAKEQLSTAKEAAAELQSILDSDENLPEWVQSKITKAVDYLDTARDAVKAKQGQVELDEKAVSVAQRRAAGIAHAAQKGAIPKSKLRGASKEMAKMPAKELTKFAKTKEKGLPAKKKGAEEVEETITSGSVATAPAAAPKKSKGMQFGKGIYDSMNRELEAMISESMSVNISTSTEGSPSVSVTATDEDAAQLAQILRAAGIGGELAGQHNDTDCPTCGSSPCGCAEVVDENQPDWPTNTETSNDALQYSGGLNKPKTDVAGAGQTTVPVTAVREQEGNSKLTYDQQHLKNALGDELFNELKASMESDAELSDTLMDAVMEYYMNSGDMPYGTMKARDGDPYDWIANKLSDVFPFSPEGLDQSETSTTPMAEAACNMTAEGEMCPEHGMAECGMDEAFLGTGADRLLARTGMNVGHRFPRSGQTDMGDIPAGNQEPQSDSARAVMDRLRAERPESLKAAIKGQLGKHRKPNLPEESMDEDLGRMRELAGVHEAAKPDFLDLDQDGNKSEPMKKADAEQDSDVKESADFQASLLDMTRLWKQYKA